MLNKMKSHLFVGKTILSYLVSLSFILGAVNLGAVRKAPYLIYREYEDEDDNEVQCREMQILCQLEGEDDCKIQWRTGEEFYNNYVDMESSETGHQYFYTIENLTPGKLYYYKVTIGREEPKVYESSFRANPATDATTAKFFVYGDTRLYPEVHDEVAADIIANYADNPTWQTCVISVGDLVNNGGNENNWDGEFFDPSYPNIQEMLATMPYQSCIGNHEFEDGDDGGGGTLFRKYFPYPYYQDPENPNPNDTHYWSFDYGPAHFTYVDQYELYDETEDEYYCSGAQLRWIEQDLDETDKKWKFLVLHHPGWGWQNPPQPEGRRHHNNNTQVQSDLQPLCIEHGVSFVFGGHNHFYARAEVGGVQHITTGGGGAELVDEPPIGDLNYPNIVESASAHHYCRVEIIDDILTFEAVDTTGIVFDAVTLEKKDLTTGYNWVCFPVLDNISPGANQAGNVLADILAPDILHEVLAQRYMIVYDGVGWNHANEVFHYTNGFKVDMLTDFGLFVPGDLAPSDTVFDPIYAHQEEWMGYFLLETLMCDDAIGNIHWDKVVSIQAQDWYYNPEANIPSRRMRPFEFGKMYVITFDENINNFVWNTSIGAEPVEPFVRQKPTYFEYEEKANYEVIDILDIPEDVVEIGVYQDDRCVGAVVTDEDAEQILVYSDRMNRDETIFTFQLVYGRGSSVPFNNYTIYDAEVGNYVKGNIVAGRQDYSAIRFESGEPSDPPQVMRLLGNFPNPFNPTTTISFSLTTNLHEKARIEIFNIKGQKIENLQITNSPNQQIIWDASKFASGVYLYKLVVDDKTVDTKKMILLK